jgi:hypothetical protein
MMLEQLGEQPLALGVIALVVIIGIGRFLWQRRRASALRDHAQQQGWRQLNENEVFVARVLDAFPELRDEVEQDARASRGRRGAARGPGSTIRVGSTPGVRSRASSRGAYAVPFAGGEAAVGDVQVIGQAGRVSQGRASSERGAVVAELSTPAPKLRLLGRAWLDRDGNSRLPSPLDERFSEDDLEDDAAAAYLEPGAVNQLTAAADDLDGVAVEGTTAVLLARRGLTPQRAGELTAALEAFLGEAAGPGGSPISAARFPGR